MDWGLVAGLGAAVVGSSAAVEFVKGYWQKRVSPGDNLSLVQEMQKQITELYAVVDKMRTELIQCHKDNAQLSAKIVILETRLSGVAVPP